MRIRHMRAGEGREAEGFLLPWKTGRQGGRRRRRKQTEKTEQLTRHRKKDRLEDIFSPGKKGRDADRYLFCIYIFFP